MGDESSNGWREYSRFVLAMLERLDEQYKQLVGDHAKSQHDISDLRTELFNHVDKKFDQLASMHKSQIESARRELIEELQDQKKEDSEVQVAKITGSWEFKTSIATGFVSIVLALIAIFT